MLFSAFLFRGVFAERMEALCEKLMHMRRVPRRSDDVESQVSKVKGKKVPAEKRHSVRKVGSASGRGAPRSRPMHSNRDGSERQVRQARPGSAQAFLAVRKQAHQRRQGAGGNW